MNGKIEVTSEAVAGSGGNDAERDRSADQTLGDFVNGAVAADREYDIEPITDDGIEIFSILALGDLEFPVAGFADDCHDVAAPLRAGAAVHDEEGLHTFASR